MNKIRKKIEISLIERKNIENFIKQKYSLPEISVFLNRSINTIKSEIYRFTTNKYEYNAEKAQALSLQRKQEQQKKISRYKDQEKLLIIEKLNERIEILEMQLNILIEEVKKLHEEKD